jgi:hypothetical protein
MAKRKTRSDSNSLSKRNKFGEDGLTTPVLVVLVERGFLDMSTLRLVCKSWSDAFYARVRSILSESAIKVIRDQCQRLNYWEPPFVKTGLLFHVLETKILERDKSPFSEEWMKMQEDRRERLSAVYPFLHGRPLEQKVLIPYEISTWILLCDVENNISWSGRFDALYLVRFAYLTKLALPTFQSLLNRVISRRLLAIYEAGRLAGLLALYVFPVSLIGVIASWIRLHYPDIVDRHESGYVIESCVGVPFQHVSIPYVENVLKFVPNYVYSLASIYNRPLGPLDKWNLNIEKWILSNREIHIPQVDRASMLRVVLEKNPLHRLYPNLGESFEHVDLSYPLVRQALSLSIDDLGDFRPQYQNYFCTKSQFWKSVADQRQLAFHICKSNNGEGGIVHLARLLETVPLVSSFVRNVLADDYVSKRVFNTVVEYFDKYRNQEWKSFDWAYIANHSIAYPTMIIRYWEQHYSYKTLPSCFVIFSPKIFNCLGWRNKASFKYLLLALGKQASSETGTEKWELLVAGHIKDKDWRSETKNSK